MFDSEFDAETLDGGMDAGSLVENMRYPTFCPTPPWAVSRNFGVGPQIFHAPTTCTFVLCHLVSTCTQPAPKRVSASRGPCTQLKAT